MTDPGWLDEREDRAWRSLMTMQDGLTEFIERQLRNRCGLSNADYQVLAHLSEAPAGQLRSFELGGLLRWEKSRLSQHVADVRDVLIDHLTAAELEMLTAIGDKVRVRLAALEQR